MNIIKKNKPKVLLASMPWTNLVEPSLGLGILKSQLDKGNITCNIRHFNIFLLQYISIKTYANIANNFAINDFIFTHPFESDISIEQEEHCRIVAIEAIKNNNINDDRYNTADKLATMLIKLRNHIIPQYLSNCLEYIRKYNPTMIGFSCLFDQTIASIALAKIVKEYNPNIFIVLGGYAVDGIIGEQLIKSFSFIDCIAFGAGECLIEDLAKASIDNTLLDKIPNICYRKKNNDTVYYLTNSNNNFNINESPIPNYDDFVSDIDELSLNHQVDIAWHSIPIQTSCGCWWGERHQCVFCGINDRSIKYNYKKSEIVLSHITELYKKYNKYIFSSKNKERIKPI